MAENNRIGDITKTSLDSIRAMLDPNTVVGDPIETAAGTTEQFRRSGRHGSLRHARGFPRRQ